VRLTALAMPGQVTAPPEEYAVTSLSTILGNAPTLKVGDRQPDVFLGGWPCLRHTFVHTGTSPSSPVRSEFWWAGVVAGRGIQIFVLGMIIGVISMIRGGIAVAQAQKLR
jgi:hypothetical protein